MTDPAPENERATAFEAQRTHLRAVAYRMLGSVHEADDVVQDAWLRLVGSQASEIENLPAWLTTVVSRLCLDRLRSRSSRREDPPADGDADTNLADPDADPAHDAVLADQVGSALRVVLDTLAPAERLAFVLHDLFAVPFDEIATVMGRSPAAVRQLASRSRRRVQSSDDEHTTTAAERRTQRDVVSAFLLASRHGNLDRLLELLDPGAVVRADPAAAAMGAEPLIAGAADVANTYNGRAKAARLVEIDGYAGLAWQLHGVTQVAFAFVLTGDHISEIHLIADPAALAALDLTATAQPRP